MAGTALPACGTSVWFSWGWNAGGLITGTGQIMWEVTHVDSGRDRFTLLCKGGVSWMVSQVPQGSFRYIHDPSGHYENL